MTTISTRNPGVIYPGVIYPEVHPPQIESGQVNSLKNKNILQYRTTPIVDSVPSIASVLRSDTKLCSEPKGAFSNKLNEQLDKYFDKKTLARLKNNYLKKEEKPVLEERKRLISDPVWTNSDELAGLDELEEPEFLDESVEDIKRNAAQLTKILSKFPMLPSGWSEQKIESLNSSPNSLEKNKNLTHYKYV